MNIDRAAFDRVCGDLERGTPLNLRMIADIFGHAFWELLILCIANINVKSDGKIEVHIHEKS